MEENKDPKSTLVDFDYKKYEEVEKKALNRDSQITLVIGIFAILTLFYIGIIGVILGIIGIAYGIKTLKNPYNNRNIAIIGMVCSAIGIVVGGIIFSFFLLAIF